MLRLPRIAVATLAERLQAPQRDAAAATEPRITVLLHGMHRTGHAMRTFQRALDLRGFLVINLTYPTTRRTLDEAADELARRLRPIHDKEFDLVAHSMGGLVARCMLAGHPELQVRRLVMIGTPNRGSEMASRWRKLPLYRLFYGKVAPQLPFHSEFLEALPPPRCEFGIIAGGRGKARGFAPWIAGDNDGLVSVESARLDGAKDFILLPVDHRRQLHSRKVVEQTLHFLERGKFDR